MVSAPVQPELRRMLAPRTIAIVGVKDATPFANSVARTVQHGDAGVYFVNPRHASVLGQPTYPSLSDLPEPVDAVYCAVSGPRTLEIASEAAGLGIGGLIAVASGFAEVGGPGIERQQQLLAAAKAGGYRLMGPNCMGVVNVRHQISLTIAADHRRRPGGISVVSQSGALMNGVAMAAWERGSVGLNVLVSSGNEADVDLADYLNYLADDPETSSIALIIEQIRRPPEFFAAARKALRNGKPVVALKLARSARTQEMAASHTGALTGDAWVYEVAFRQHGIEIAFDCEELIDRLALMEQLDPAYWSEARELAVLTYSGGYASMVMDVATDEGVTVPALEEFRPWVAQNLPGSSVPNPLDTTGLGGAKWPEILEMYGSSEHVDAALFVHPLSDADSSSVEMTLKPYLDSSAVHRKPFIVSNCAAALGESARQAVAGTPSAAEGHGPRAALRGLASLGHFVQAQRSVGIEPVAAPLLPRPASDGLLSFADSMNLLLSQGIPVAPYHLIGVAEPASSPSFAGPFVVKLADVGHRTEHGAVLLNVAPAELSTAVDRLREIARRDGLAATVAVQPMVAAQGEVFVGVQNSELGPLVVFGLGGVLVEVLKRVGGRMAPFTPDTARALIAEFDDTQLMHGFRGSAPWDLDALTDILVRIGNLAAGSRDWLESLDINPLLVTSDGFLAVDALFLARS
ncbi:acetate--CoA ligase family protein [Kineosporia babensis]|uniref:Acetate--CoA ligase family protein n=1 Tax=Kineosporia babensis TaxID=499548 RepID=A0A9X1NHY0_9ACTN|nr:acetate--CoA ligase family protein [Kineosporia babensis]MCD5314468.1 acetate--CoA ligase family protein [Kineosporia babensis]